MFAAIIAHRGGRRGDRHPDPQRRPVGRVDDRPRRVRRRRPARPRRSSTCPAAIAFGIGLGLVLGMINGVLVAVLGVPVDRRDARDAVRIYRGFDFLIAGGKQVTLTELPAGYTELARETIIGIPIFVWLALDRHRRRRDHPAADHDRPAGLRGRQQPRGGRDPRDPDSPVVFSVFSVVRPARRRRRRPVGHGVRDDQRDRGDRRRAPGHRRRGRRRREHLRWIGDRRRRRRSVRSSSASSRTRSSCCGCRSSGCRRSTALVILIAVWLDARSCAPRPAPRSAPDG